MEKSTALFNYSMLRQTVYSLKEKYPFAGYSVCARSWGGRALFTLSLGSRQNAALYVAGFDGRDTASVGVLLRFFEAACGAYKTGAQLSGIKLNDIFETKGIAIIPCVNPDGMEIQNSGAIAAGCYAGLVERVSGGELGGWRANARGVDLNLNFSSPLRQAYSGAAAAPAPAYFAGKVSESEPETRALVKLCRSRDVRHALVLKSGDNLMHVRTGSKEPQRAEMMAKILASSSGCTPAEFDGTAENVCGMIDRFSAEFGRPSFMFEANGDALTCYRRLEETLVLSAIM